MKTEIKNVNFRVLEMKLLLQKIKRIKMGKVKKWLKKKRKRTLALYIVLGLKNI